MHLFFRTVGFSEFDMKDEEKLIKSTVNSAIRYDRIQYHKKLQRGIVTLETSKKTGMYIYGQYNGKQFKAEYYVPYLLGSNALENDEITVERHIDKEAYAVVCDELKAGVTLIFYLQNLLEYFNHILPDTSLEEQNTTFSLHHKNMEEKKEINGKKVILSALSIGGMILLPLSKSRHQIQKYEDAASSRRNLIAAAKRGDEEALESLTIEDLDTYTKLSKRIVYEDVFSLVDSSFMPCGVECDQYSVVGEILNLEKEENRITGEEIYIMTLECNDMVFDVAINSSDLVGEPVTGRRFKGQIWLQGKICFKED